jgi:hypothetical protein
VAPDAREESQKKENQRVSDEMTSIHGAATSDAPESAAANRLSANRIWGGAAAPIVRPAARSASRVARRGRTGIVER